MNPTYEEIEAKIALLEVQLKLSEAAERAWESSMMRACGEDGPKSVADKFSELKAKRRELAAENAAMHETIEAVRSVADNSSGITGWHLNGDIATWEEILPEINEIKTPATNTFMAEVRASARNDFIGRIEWIIRNECNPDKTEAIINELQNFSDELKLEAAQ